MERIESFTINHLKLLPGLYVSRRDKKDGIVLMGDREVTKCPAECEFVRDFFQKEFQFKRK